MPIVRLSMGALLTMALLMPQEQPAADPRIVDGELTWFLLKEKKEQVARTLGQPKYRADFGVDFESWQYQLGETEHEEFSHQLVFRKSSGELVSVARNYQPERNVDPLFPERQTRAHHYPDAKNPQFSLRLQRLPGGRLLMAMGVLKAGQATGQILLIKESELRHFYPWLSKELETTGSGR